MLFHLMTLRLLTSLLLKERSLTYVDLQVGELAPDKVRNDKPQSVLFHFVTLRSLTSMLLRERSLTSVSAGGGAGT